MRQHAVDKIAATNLDRQEHPGIGATGAYGINDRAGVKDDGFASVEVGSSNAQRNLEIFEGLALQRSREKRDHAVVGGESAAGKCPAREAGEASVAGNVFHLADGEAAAVAGAD